MAPGSPNHDTIRNKEKAIFHTRCYWTRPYPFAFTGMASESCQVKSSQSLFVPCLRTHFLVQVKSTFVKVFFCYLMVSWFPWKTYLISGQYETHQINLVISTNLVANDGVKLLGFDQLATLKRQFFPFRAVANLSSRSFASYSGKGKALGMSLVRGPKPA